MWEVRTDSLLAKKTCSYGCRGEVETEGAVTAARDRALQSEWHGTKILETEIDSKCRICKQFDETVENITSTCSIWAKEEYIKRHDKVYAQLHFNKRKEMGVKLDYEHWYDHVPKSVETSREGR